MPKYKVNNKTYNLPEDKVESFLLRFPDAIAIKDEPQDFPTSTVEDADAVQQPMTASQAGFTESPSVDTPSESQDTEKVEDVPLAPADPSLELQPSFPFSVNGYQVTKEEFEQYEQDLANQDKIEDSESFYTIPGYVDFFSDMHRSWKEGLKQSEIVEPAFDLLSSGGDSTDKEVADFVNKNKEIARKNLGSAEMKEFDRIYEEEGGGFWGFIKGAYKNPSVLPSMLISSVASQAGSIYYSNQVKAAAAAGAATGAAVSGGAGVLPGIMGGSMMAMETGLTFSELLQEEAGGLDSKEIKKILKDPERLADLKNKAIGRGLTIAATELATLGVAKGVGGKIAKAGFRGAPIAGATTSGAVEMIGGSTGEVAGRFVAGQEMNAKDIISEGVVGKAGAPLSLVGQLRNLKTNIDRVKINKQVKNSDYSNIVDVFNPETKTDAIEINLSKIKNSEKILNEELNTKLDNGEITSEQADKIKTNAAETQGILNRIKPLNLTENNEIKVVELQKEKAKLNSEIKRVNDKALTTPQIERVKTIDNELAATVVRNTTEKVMKIAEDVKSVNIEIAKDQKQADQIVKDRNLIKKAASEHGYVLQDSKTGKQTIVINEEIANKDFAVNVAAHEFLHATLFQTVKDSPETQIALGTSLNEYINKIDANQIKNSEFANRLKRYKESDKATQSEEVLTLFSDAIATGDIKFNENVFTKIGDVIRRALQNAGLTGIKFNSGKDVYNFVKDYNKSIEKGKLTKAQKAITEKQAKGKLVKEKIDAEIKTDIKSSKSLELQEQLDNLDEFDFDNEVDFQTAKTNLETKIRLAKKKETANPAVSTEIKEKIKEDTKKNEKRIGDQLKSMVPLGTTNKEFKEKNAVKVIDDIDKGMLNPLIKKIAAGYGVVADNVYGKSWDDFFTEVAGVQLKKNIMAFNPESNDDLGGYIIGSQYGVRNRVKEALAKFKKEGEGGFKEDVSVAKNIAAKEDTTIQEKEKRKYTPITKSNVIPNFTVTAITDKLTNVLSNLTTKMTDKRGANAATTPLIAEIRKNIGKVVGDPEAAPKLVIQRLGKLKDGTYEKNLIKNKKAIVENMTTTFLMGKDNGKKVSGGIPQAIEKSVGGKFTGKKVTVNVGGKEVVQEEFAPNFVPYPEWVGQKIDREKTLVRGATAGNEIVRRVPADKVSDADFVGLFIDEKGKLIRGKREALGKAIAEEVAFEIFTKEIQNENSAISKAFEGNQEAQGEVLNDNFVNQILRDADRGTVKFSVSNEQIIESANKITSAETNTQRSIAIANLREIMPEDDFNRLTNLVIDPYTEFLNKIKEEGWKATEQQAIDNIVKIAKKIPGLVVLQTELQVDSSKPDLIFKYKGLEIAWEIKSGKTARLGKFILKGQGKNNELNKNISEEYKEKILKNDLQNKNVQNVYNELEKLLNDKKVTLTQTGNYRVDHDVFYANVANLLKGTDTRNLILDTGIVKEYYADKETPVNYISFSDLGDFMLNENPLNLDIAKFDGKVFIRQKFDERWYNKDNPDKKTYVILMRSATPTLTNDSAKKLESKSSIFVDKSFEKALKSTSLKSSKSDAVDLNEIGLEPDSNHESLLRIQFSKSKRKEYENVLRNKRPDLKDIPSQVDELFKWADGLKVPDNKKSKYKKLALYYTVNGYTIFPEDGYKIEEAIRLSEVNKIDPYAYKNPDELINKFAKEEKARRINPDTVKEFSNKRSLPKGVTIYDVVDSKAGQMAMRKVADSNWGKDFNGWCLIARKPNDKSELDTARTQWKNYNEDGNGYVVAFQNGKLISFRDGSTDMKWWDRFDKPTANLQINLGKKDGLTTRGEINSQGGVDIVGYGEGDFMGRKATYKIYDLNKELIEAKVYKDGKLALTVQDTPTKMNNGGKAVNRKKSKYVDGVLASSFTTTKDLTTGKIVTTFDVKIERLDENNYIQTIEWIGKNGKSPALPKVNEKTIEIIQKREVGFPQSTEYYAERVTAGVKDVVVDKMNELKTVKESFNQKNKVYKPSVKFSKSMNSTFNKMLERSTGIAADETISGTIANRRGKNKGKFKLFIPSSLDDFKGLTSYTFAGKGKQGEADQKFFKDALIDPYFKGIRAIEETRQSFKDDFKALNKQMRPVIKKLGKLVPETEFTHDQAIRVALWEASGYDIPGLSEIDQKKLVEYVNNDAELSEYARKLQQIAKRPKWAKPGDFWDAETILSDLNNLTEKVGRKEFLSEFIENADIIFSEDNLNKIQAGFGEPTKDALKDILYRMKNGTNRPSTTTNNTNKWNNWINNSIGAIMFFNRRSALLQTLSTVNFINWSDNNPIKAAAAFANQKQ